MTNANPTLPNIPAANFNVTAFGALGDGVSDNTAAIQATINAAILAGGGTVEIPAGTYLCGPLTLGNKINLQIDTNATLKMFALSTWTNFPAQNQTYGNLIYAKNFSDLEISGSGTIDGQGADWWTAPKPVSDNRPNMVFFNGGCHRVLIQDVTLQNPPTMHIVFKGVDDNITIQGITINTTASNAKNTDGIDLVGTSCLVQNCTINAGDDNIALGSSGSLTVSSDILITNCTFGVGHGVSIGSNTAGGVSNLTVTARPFDGTNYAFNGTEYGIRMKSDNFTSGGSGQGGLAQNLWYSNITMTNIMRGAIVIYSYYKEYGTPTDFSPFAASTQAVGSVLQPVWRNITISDVTASVTGSIAGIIWGRKEMVVSNVTLSRVSISAPSGFDIYNARNIQIVDSQISVTGTGSVLSLYNAEITVTNSAATTNLVKLAGLATPLTNNPMAFFNAQAAITDTNMLGTGPITLGGGALSFSQSSVNSSNTPITIVSGSTLVVTSGTNTFNGALSGPGPLTLNLTNNNIMVALQGDASAYTGSLTVTNNGTLRFNQGTNPWGGANAGFDAGSSGTMDNGSATSVAIFMGALSGGSRSTLRGSDQAGPGVDTYVIGWLNSNTTFAGAIADGTSGGTPHVVALTKIGTGTFTLSGANAYTGGTTVSNGTLLVNNTAGGGTGPGAVTVISGATLGGTGTIAGPVTVNGTLAPGSPDTGVGGGTVTVSSDLVLNSGAVMAYDLGTVSDLTAVSGNLALDGTLNVSDAGGFTNSTYTLFSYGGALTYTGITIGTAPAGYGYMIDTGTAHQVSLVVLTPFQQWQVDYFGAGYVSNPASAANADPDGDGLNNLAEFLAGTNPTNSLSGLRITSATQQSNDVLITWTTAGGRTNVVQATAEDTGAGYTNNFTDIPGSLTVVTGRGDATTNYLDVGGATNIPSRYYRIRLVP